MHNRGLCDDIHARGRPCFPHHGDISSHGTQGIAELRLQYPKLVVEPFHLHLQMRVQQWLKRLRWRLVRHGHRLGQGFMQRLWPLSLDLTGPGGWLLLPHLKHLRMTLVDVLVQILLGFKVLHAVLAPVQHPRGNLRLGVGALGPRGRCLLLRRPRPRRRALPGSQPLMQRLNDLRRGLADHAVVLHAVLQQRDKLDQVPVAHQLQVVQAESRVHDIVTVCQEGVHVPIPHTLVQVEATHEPPVDAAGAGPEIELCLHRPRSLQEVLYVMAVVTDGRATDDAVAPQHLVEQRAGSLARERLTPALGAPQGPECRRPAVAYAAQAATTGIP